MPTTFESNGGRYFRNCTVVFTKVKLTDGPKTLCHDCCSVAAATEVVFIVIDSI